jgi:MFS family permease
MQVPASVAAPTEDRVLNANFLKLFVAVHLCMNDSSLYYLLPYLLELRGAPPYVYGLAAGTAGVSTVVSLLLFGRYSDRWSRKTTVIAYLLAMVLGDVVALLAVDGSIGWYFVARALHGVYLGLGFPLVFGWAVELCPRRHRYLALSWMGIAGILSNTVGPFLSELILHLSGNPRDPAGFRAVFATGLVFTLVAGGIFLTVNDRRVPHAAAQGGLRSLLKRREAALVLVVALAFGGMFGSLMSFGKNYTESRGLTFVSLLMLMYSLGAIASRIFIRQISARLPHVQLAATGLLGCCVAFTLLGFADGYLMQAASGLVYGFSHGVLYPTLYVRFIDFGGPSQIGRSATTFQGAFSIGIGALPVLGGFLIAAAGFPIYFWSLAGLALVTVWINQRSDPARAFRAPAVRDIG